MTSPVRPLRSRLLTPETLPFTDPKERRWFYNYRGAGGPRVTYASDSFGRADSASTLGGGWTVSGGTAGILSGAAYVAASGVSVFAMRNLGVADVDYTGDVMLWHSGGSGSRAFLAIRDEDLTGNNCYLVGMNPSPFDTIRLIKVTGGSKVDVDTASLSATSGQFYSIHAVARGRDITVSVDGVSLLSAVDADYDHHRAHGFNIVRSTDTAIGMIDNVVIQSV